MVIAIAVLASAPIVGAAIAVAGDDWIPTSDDALIALATRDVGRHTPTFGVYSRFGFHHPGPALFVTLAPAYRLLGPEGLPIGAALVASVSLAGAAWLLWRRGGDVLGLAGTAVLALLARSLAAEIVDPWNPWISLLPFALLIVAAWSVVCGERWALPVTLGAASWLVQVHLGYAPMAGALSVVAVGAAVYWARRRRRDPVRWMGTDAGWRWPAVVALVVVGAAWFWPLAGELADEPGNLEQIVQSFRNPTEEPAGLGKAVGQVARGTGMASGWLTGVDDIDPFLGELYPAPVWYLLVPLAASAAAAGLGIARLRRRETGQHHVLLPEALAGQAVVWGTVVVSLVAVSRIAGPTYHYLLRWQWVLAALIWLTAGWTLYVTFAVGGCGPPPDGPRRRLLVGVLGAAAIVSSLAMGVAVARVDLPDAVKADAILAVLGPTLDAVADRGPVLVGFEGSTFGEYHSGLVAALEERGLEVWVPDARALEFGGRRTQQGRTPGATVVIVTGEGIDARLANGEDPLAIYDPLTAEEREQLAPLQARIAQAFEDAQAGVAISDPLTDDEEAFVRAMNAKGDRIAVFAEPSSADG